MTRRLVLLFAGWFTTTTALDLISTWVGVVQMGYTEKNPYTDLSSVEGAVIPGSHWWRYLHRHGNPRRRRDVQHHHHPKERNRRRRD